MNADLNNLLPACGEKVAEGRMRGNSSRVIASEAKHIHGQTLDHCRTCPWIASSLTLLAMTGPHSLSPQAGREDARRYRARRLCVLDDAAIERPRAWCGIFPQLCR